MIRAVIIDDIEKARVALRSDISEYCRDVKVIGEADGVEAGIKLIERNFPDLIFLDIKMGDGTGFDLIERIKNLPDLNAKIIFTTAFNEYAIKAFKFSAVDYLLKPVDPDDLKEAIEKVRDRMKKESLKDNLDVLLSNIKETKSSPKRIALNSADKIQVVLVEEIVRCESQSNYTIVYLSSGKQILVTRSLKEFEEMLEVHNFIRVHNSHLINPAFLKEFQKQDSMALMTDNSLIPVSVRKKEQLLRFFGL